MGRSTLCVTRVAGMTALGVSTVLMAGPGTSVCGCPANCSPIVCVQTLRACTNVSQYGVDCNWVTCFGHEWIAPGPWQVASTEQGNTCTCIVNPGVMINGVCTYDSTIPYTSWYTVHCVLSWSKRPCEEDPVVP